MKRELKFILENNTKEGNKRGLEEQQNIRHMEIKAK